MNIFFHIILLFSLSCTKNENPQVDSHKINLIKKGLSHKNRYAKIEASETIFKLKIYDPEISELLIKNLENDDPGVRTSSILALGSMEEKSLDSIPHFIKLLEDESESVSRKAAWALNEKTGKKGREKFIEFLKEKVPLLEDKENFSNRILTSKFFGKLGPYGELSTTLLGERLLYDPHPSVRLESAKSLGKIGSIEALPYLNASLMVYKVNFLSVLKVDPEILFRLNKIPFKLFKINLSGDLSLVTTASNEEIQKLKLEPYLNHLYTYKNNVFYKNNFNKYVPLFTDKHKPRKWVNKIYIKDSLEKSYIDVPIELFPQIKDEVFQEKAGKRFESSQFVREAAEKAIKFINN